MSRPVSKAHSKGADALSIPYSSIIKLIPQELWGKLAPAGVAGYNFTIARKTVLEQLPHGAVKVNFGELRRNAPTGVFVNGSAEDGRMVDLPLSEILAQLHPDNLSRRADQTRIEVSPDVPDLFGVKGERLAPLRVMEKKEVSNTSTISRQKGATAFTPKPATPAPQAPIQPAPPRPTAPPPAPAPAIRMQPAQPAAQAPTVSQRPAATAPISAPKPTTPPLPTAAGRALPKLPSAQPKAAPAPEQVAAIPFSIPPVPMGTPSFFIALDAIASGWPDGIRQELAQLKIPEAKVALPPVEICEGLKRARVQYPWRTLRSWIQPTPIYATPSPFDDMVLELPLRTLTPLFLEFIRSNPVNRQVADADNITEFFKKAERASGTSAELLQPLFDPPTAPEPPQRLQAAPPPAGFAAPAPSAQTRSVPASNSTATPSTDNYPTVEGNAICLPIATLANGWPEPVMHDIASFGLGSSRIEIPLAAIEPGLKSGRLSFTWRELCSWLNPPSNPAQLSINGETPLALPLGLVAPLFMKARGNGQVRRKTNVDQEIPDLFSAAGKPLNPPQSAVQSPTPAVEAPAPVPAAAPAPVAKKLPTNLSELFEEPAKKTWTPNEIVQRSTRLPNVAGTLIALQDGLLVAANMPPDLKTETIAAFVPQIFGRMNQYSRELQMGETTAVSFTVDVGTIQVYNAGIIYFAALAKTSDPLPLRELQLIAGELSRHTK